MVNIKWLWLNTAVLCTLWFILYTMGGVEFNWRIYTGAILLSVVLTIGHYINK